MAALTYAGTILTRAVALDTQAKYTESLVLYEEGIQILLEALKNIDGGGGDDNEEKRKKLTAKAKEFMSRAEKVKKHVERLKSEGNYREQLQIEENSTGHSYDRVFSRFLDASVTVVHVDDPYIRLPHQCENFVRLVELVLRSCPNLKQIYLNTKRDEHNFSDQNTRLGLVASSASTVSHGAVHVQISYSDTLHDREIRLDNGWVIKIGRGLDYFKPVDKFCVGSTDFYYRPCRATTIDIFHKKELVRCGS